MVRIHRVPRRGLFDAATCPDPMPVPVECVDVRRATIATPETADEKSISDICNGTVATRRTFSDLWVGETHFLKLWSAPLGYDLVDGGLIRRQKASRPPDIWPEMWQATSKKIREKAVTEWGRFERNYPARNVASRPHRWRSWDCSGCRRQDYSCNGVRWDFGSVTCGLNRKTL